MARQPNEKHYLEHESGREREHTHTLFLFFLSNAFIPHSELDSLMLANIILS